MCSRDFSNNNNIIIADGIDNGRQFTTEECVCLINKRVQALIRFQDIEFTCVPRRTWQMEFYTDGCLEKTITCDNPDDNEFFIQYQSSARDIHIRLKQIDFSDPDSGSYYSLKVSSTAADSCKYFLNFVESVLNTKASKASNHFCSCQDKKVFFCILYFCIPICPAASASVCRSVLQEQRPVSLIL